MQAIFGACLLNVNNLHMSNQSLEGFLLGLNLLDQSIEHVGVCLRVALALYYGIGVVNNVRRTLYKRTRMLPRVVLPHGD